MAAKLHVQRTRVGKAEIALGEKVRLETRRVQRSIAGRVTVGALVDVQGNRLGMRGHVVEATSIGVVGIRAMEVIGAVEIVRGRAQRRSRSGRDHIAWLTEIHLLGQEIWRSSFLLDGHVVSRVGAAALAAHSVAEERAIGAERVDGRGRGGGGEDVHTVDGHVAHAHMEKARVDSADERAVGCSVAVGVVSGRKRQGHGHGVLLLELALVELLDVVVCWELEARWL